MDKVWLFRYQVRGVPCPVCRAAQFSYCVDDQGVISEKVHQKRTDFAKEIAQDPNGKERLKEQERERLENLREVVREIGCFKCGAGPGIKCKKRNGVERLSNHKERLDEARKLFPEKIQKFSLIFSKR